MILAKIAGKPLDVLVCEKVLEPMGLRNTTPIQTSDISDPALHISSGERRPAPGIPPNDSTFSEEATLEHPVGHADRREPDHNH